MLPDLFTRKRSSSSEDRKALIAESTSVFAVLHLSVAATATLKWAKSMLLIGSAISITFLSVPAWVVLFRPLTMPNNAHRDSLTSAAQQYTTQPYLSYHGFNPPNLSRWVVLDCGLSKSEALAKGCVWAPRESGWISPRCIDADLNATFWQGFEEDYFTDAGGETKIDPDEVESPFGKFSDITPWDPPEIYISWLRHNTHCEYALRTLSSALSTSGMGIAERFFDLEHTLHCLDVFVGKEVRPLDFKMHVSMSYLNCYVPVA